MAIPVVESVTTTIQGASTTFELFMPSTRPDGDLYLAIVGKDDEVAMAAEASWTTIQALTDGSGSYSGVWYRIGDSEPESYNWHGDNEPWKGGVLHISGFDSDTPIDDSSVSYGTSTDERLWFNTTTATNEDGLVVWSGCLDTDTIFATPPTDSVVLFNMAGGSGVVSLAASWVTGPAATASSEITHWLIDSAANDQWQTVTTLIGTEQVSAGSTQEYDLQDSLSFTVNLLRDQILIR